MNDLIVPKSEGFTITSFSLWNQLNSFRVSSNSKKIQHGDFLSRVEDECDDLGVSEIFLHPQNNMPLKSYTLSRDQALLVGMRESKAVRKKVLHWLKDASNDAHHIPQTLSQALMLAATQAQRIELQSEALKLAEPKVKFVDSFVDSKGNKTFREVAKLLNANERGFRKFLAESRIMYRLNSNWAAYGNHIDAGRFSVNTGEKNGHAYTECRFTPKGIEYVAGKWITRKENS